MIMLQFSSRVCFKAIEIVTNVTVQKSHYRYMGKECVITANI